MDPFAKKQRIFLRQLGVEIGAKTGEPKATEYLFQSLSMVVQKGNALSILGTKGEGEPEDCLSGVLAVL